MCENSIKDICQYCLIGGQFWTPYYVCIFKTWTYFKCNKIIKCYICFISFRRTTSCWSIRSNGLYNIQAVGLYGPMVYKLLIYTAQWSIQAVGLFDPMVYKLLVYTVQWSTNCWSTRSNGLQTVSLHSPMVYRPLIYMAQWSTNC